MIDADLEPLPAGDDAPRGWSRRTIIAIVLGGALLCLVFGAALAFLMSSDLVSKELTPAERDLLVTLADLDPAATPDPARESWMRTGGTPFVRQIQLDYRFLDHGDGIQQVHCVVALDVDAITAAAGWVGAQSFFESSLEHAGPRVEVQELEGLGDEARFAFVDEEHGRADLWLIARTGRRRLQLSVVGCDVALPEDPAAFFAPHLDKLRDYRP